MARPKLKRGDLRPGERRRLDPGIYARGRLDGSIGYEIRFRFHGHDIRESAPTITKARQALTRRKDEIWSGKFQFATNEPSPLFRTFATDYLAHAKTNKKSWRLDAECLKPLNAHFGDKRLSQIVPWHIEQYKASRRATVSARTVNIELSILRRMFTLARAWKKARDNPVLDVKRFREDQKHIRVLSPDEEKRLLSVSPPHLRDFIILALNTGLRLGELRHLAGTDVNLAVGALTVTQSKTGRVRHVPLNAAALDVVKRGLAAGTPTILTYQKKPIGEIHRTWYRAINKAKLPGLRIHDLRHTFATRLVLKGVDLATVASLLGHSSIQMTMRYSHPSPDNKRAAVAKLEG